MAEVSDPNHDQARSRRFHFQIPSGARSVLVIISLIIGEQTNILDWSALEINKCVYSYCFATGTATASSSRIIAERQTDLRIDRRKHATKWHLIRQKNKMDVHSWRSGYRGGFEIHSFRGPRFESWRVRHDDSRCLFLPISFFFSRLDGHGDGDVRSSLGSTSDIGHEFPSVKLVFTSSSTYTQAREVCYTSPHHHRIRVLLSAEFRVHRLGEARPDGARTDPDQIRV